LVGTCAVRVSFDVAHGGIRFVVEPQLRLTRWFSISTLAMP